MSPRKASLRVAHARSCPNVTKTALTSVGTGSGSGCTCEPSYYVFYRDREGRPVKESTGKGSYAPPSARSAPAQGEIDEGRAGVAKPKNISFAEWPDAFEGILDGASSGRAAPAHETLLRQHARPWAGHVRVAPPARDRQSRATPVPRAVSGLKPASRLRYLREFGACLAVAVGDRYLEVNPVPAFTKATKLTRPAGKSTLRGRGARAALDRARQGQSTTRSGLSVRQPLLRRDGPAPRGADRARVGNVDLLNGRVRVEHQWDNHAGR